MTIWKPDTYDRFKAGDSCFRTERVYNSYLKAAGQIERELGIAYEGKTDYDLMKFVKAHISELPYKQEPVNKPFKKKKKKRKYKPLKPAPTKQGGMIRKHGEKEFK